MDGENNGKPYFLMDGLGGKTTIFGNIHIASKPQSDDHPRRVVLSKSKYTQKLLTRGLFFDGTLIMVKFLKLIQEILQRSGPTDPEKNLSIS